jgi:hypothetical protein
VADPVVDPIAEPNLADEDLERIQGTLLCVSATVCTCYG